MDEDFKIDELIEDDETTDWENEPSDHGDKAKMELYDWLQCVVSAVLCGIFVFIFIGRPIGVDGPSMMNTLNNKDRIVISNLFYTPKNGDIIVFRAPSYEQPLVKRIIAVAGQTIDIDFTTGEVTVWTTGDMSTAKVLDEPYIRELTYTREDFTEPVVVPEGCVFVMGDNRNDSSDSRSDRIGLVDTRYILGKVMVIAIPGKDTYGLRQWSRIGSVYG